MMRNIVLIGFMGSGKSVVGNRLANLRKKRLISTDAMIEKKENRSIRDIFRESGEEYFREIERAIVEDISQKTDFVIDCGGGVVLNEANVRNLKTSGVIFYLLATAEDIHHRVRNTTHRPLLASKNSKETIKRMLAQRGPLYEKAADYTIDTTGLSVPRVVAVIQEILDNDNT